MGCHAWRQPLAGGVTFLWQARPFYTASTPRIPERSRLRRELVPRSPVLSRPDSNDLSRLDRLGELLLRVVRVAGLRGRRFRVLAARPDRARAAGDHPGIDLRRHRHSADGEAGAAQQGRGVCRVSAAREPVRAAAAYGLTTRATGIGLSTVILPGSYFGPRASGLRSTSWPRAMRATRTILM